MALVLLLISLLGAKGRKDEKLGHKTAFAYILTGLLLYFLSQLGLLAKALITHVAVAYIGLTTVGFLLVLTGGTLLSRIIKSSLNNKDIFNAENETFPQEERPLENEYSINLPARYRLRNKLRKSWINIINPFRAMLVLGSPGAGKSYFVIRHVITQHMFTTRSRNTGTCIPKTPGVTSSTSTKYCTGATRSNPIAWRTSPMRPSRPAPSFWA